MQSQPNKGLLRYMQLTILAQIKLPEGTHAKPLIHKPIVVVL